MNPVYRDWTKTNGDSIIQLTAVTGDPCKLWPYPASALPFGIAHGMPNVGDCYQTGYLMATNIGDLQAIGELLVTRQHLVQESGKAYVYLVAVDLSGEPYIRGPYKPYPDHYYNLASGLPLGNLLGKIDFDNLAKTRI